MDRSARWCVAFSVVVICQACSTIPPTLSSLHVQNGGVRNTDAPFDPLLPGRLALGDIIDLTPLHQLLPNPCLQPRTLSLNFQTKFLEGLESSTCVFQGTLKPTILQTEPITWMDSRAYGKVPHFKSLSLLGSVAQRVSLSFQSCILLVTEGGGSGDFHSCPLTPRKILCPGFHQIARADAFDCLPGCAVIMPVMDSFFLCQQMNEGGQIPTVCWLLSLDWTSHILSAGSARITSWWGLVRFGVVMCGVFLCVNLTVDHRQKPFLTNYFLLLLIFKMLYLLM